MLAYTSALVVFPLAIVMGILGYGDVVLTCVSYAVSALLLVICGYATAKYCVRLSKKLRNVADRYAFTRNLFKSFEFRTMAFGACSFVLNVGYTAFLGVMALTTDSGWYGALASYYGLITAARGGLLVQNRRDVRRYKNEPDRLYLEKTRSYFYTGLMLLTLTLSLSVEVVQIVVEGAGHQAHEGTIFVYAAYTLCRIAIAVRNFFKAKKSDDMVVRAVRNVNLAAALVSVLSLQTAWFAAFPPSFDERIPNAVTGFLVCLVNVALGIYMVSLATEIKRAAKKRPLIRGDGEEASSAYGYNREDYLDEYPRPSVQTEAYDEDGDPDAYVDLL